MSDRAAFLRAIADQPADRTARLVFADFLEETGGPGEAARAAFIRTQVEAEAAHPNSNRRAELEARARELFSAHWLDWWAPVCEAVGLPPPYRPSGGVRGWVKRRITSRQAPGFPYAKAKDAPGVAIADREPDSPLNTLHRVRFCGGFPESLSFFGLPGTPGEFLRHWTDAAPLAELDLHGIVVRDWHTIDGPHLNGLRTLRLGQGACAGLSVIAASRHLSRVEALHLILARADAHWPVLQCRALAQSPLAERITRLSIDLADVSEVLALHGAPLSKLTALEVRTPRGLSVPEQFDRAALAAADLLSLPHLDHVEELTLDVVIAPALRNVDRATLERVRKLVLTGDSSVQPGFSLGVWDLMPGLTDLSVTFPYWMLSELASLASSSFVGRLRHLRLDCSVQGHGWRGVQGHG